MLISSVYGIVAIVIWVMFFHVLHYAVTRRSSLDIGFAIALGGLGALNLATFYMLSTK